MKVRLLARAAACLDRLAHSILHDAWAAYAAKQFTGLRLTPIPGCSTEMNRLLKPAAVAQRGRRRRQSERRYRAQNKERLGFILVIDELDLGNAPSGVDVKINGRVSAPYG
jgi:hypothetical protein